MLTHRQNLVLNFMLILLILFISPVHPKSQYVEPISTGMKMSVPYDIANIFNNRYISSVIAIIISAGFAIVLIFSVITSPFGYFFGIPSRKYVLGTAPVNPHSEPSGRDFDNMDDDQIESLPSFTKNIFYLMNENDLQEEECQLLAICYGHGILSYVPTSVAKFYALFSKNLLHLNSKQRSAIISGISNLNTCDMKYGQTCPNSGFSLIVKTILSYLPENIKNSNFRKRKQAMYL